MSTPTAAATLLGFWLGNRWRGRCGGRGATWRTFFLIKSQIRSVDMWWGVTEKPLQSKCEEELPWRGDMLGWEDQFIVSSASKGHQRHQLSTPCLLVLQA